MANVDHVVFLEIKFLLLFCTLLGVCRIHRFVEKFFVSKPASKVFATIDTKSLSHFKHARFILLLLGSLESSLRNYGFFFLLFVIGIIVYFLAISLRIAAIRTLGPLWSYNVILYQDHPVIHHGIYGYLNHPAYIGNLYLVGMLLCAHAPMSATLSTVFVWWFYNHRALLEHQFVLSRQETHAQLEILPRHFTASI